MSTEPTPDKVPDGAPAGGTPAPKKDEPPAVRHKRRLAAIELVKAFHDAGMLVPTMPLSKKMEVIGGKFDFITDEWNFKPGTEDAEKTQNAIRDSRNAVAVAWEHSLKLINDGEFKAKVVEGSKKAGPEAERYKAILALPKLFNDFQAAHNKKLGQEDLRSATLAFYESHPEEADKGIREASEIMRKHLDDRPGNQQESSYLHMLASIEKNKPGTLAKAQKFGTLVREADSEPAIRKLNLLAEAVYEQSMKAAQATHPELAVHDKMRIEVTTDIANKLLLDRLRDQAISRAGTNGHGNGHSLDQDPILGVEVADDEHSLSGRRKREPEPAAGGVTRRDALVGGTAAAAGLIIGGVGGSMVGGRKAPAAEPHAAEGSGSNAKIEELQRQLAEANRKTEAATARAGKLETQLGKMDDLARKYHAYILELEEAVGVEHGKRVKPPEQEVPPIALDGQANAARPAATQQAGMGRRGFLTMAFGGGDKAAQVG